jgi:glutaredoxin 3
MNITIYTKSACPNCVSAKQLLKSKSLAYTETDLSDPQALATFCEENPGVRQMPSIWINGQHVGGFVGLQAALKQVGL